ncbi:MAG: hypothetical protein ACI82Q_002529, partial [Nonlabens sp.]
MNETVTSFEVLKKELKYFSQVLFQFGFNFYLCIRFGNESY